MPDPIAPVNDAATDSVVLSEVMILYPHFYEPHLPRGSAADAKATYQCTILLPADYDCSALERLALTTATKAFGSDAGMKLKAGAIKNPFRQQSEKAAQGKDGYAMEGRYINVKSDRQPGVVDQKMQPIIDPSAVFGGCWCNVQVNCYPWDNPLSGKGLSFGLLNVQLVRKDKPVGGTNPDPKTVFKPLAMPEVGEDSDAKIRSIFG